ncbi:MAG TPA: discoidin domain-containing protein, partial [Polyangia bacterium]|nr:discoidin domain-containing protein [Polyangia bacterium]
KQDQNGVNYTYPGSIGLAPQYETGGCNQACSEQLSACLMAHINSSGVHIPLWMDAPMDAIGWGQSPWFPTREGTFFGQIMLTNANNNLDGYFCNGPGADQNVVPGRLGFNQGKVPYANAFPTTASMDGLCDSNHGSHGGCSIHSGGDGADSCTVNGTTWNYPITVWRGITAQAEDAEGGGFDSNGNWAKALYGFQTGCNTPGLNGCAVIADAKNGMGKRVGYIGPKKGVKFTNVNVAQAGVANLVIYTTNGDAIGTNGRYLRFRVNGGTNQDLAFPGNNDWSNPVGTTISLSGFNQGTNNTIYVTADDTHAAPDLDWIEIVNSSAGVNIVTTGTCDETKWKETASVNSSTAGSGNDDNLSTRFTTGRAMAAGDYYQVDFGGIVKLSQVTLDNSQTSSSDYPATYKLLGSTDGTNFNITLAASATGGTKATMTFPVQAIRAIRVQIITANANSNWWSIGELNTACTL